MSLYFRSAIILLHLQILSNLVSSLLWPPLPLSVNLASTPFVSHSQDFCYETQCVFFLAPRSVSSVPLLHYRSTAPLSPTLKGMQTHIKRGPLILKISRLCSSYFLPSYLSVNAIRMLVGALSWQHTHTHRQTHGCTESFSTHSMRISPTAVPHSAHLANSREMDRWGLCPYATCRPLYSGFWWWHSCRLT